MESAEVISIGRLAFGFGPGKACGLAPNNAQRPTPNAFTLIEMLVLIIIIAVLCSVAVPAYARFHSKVKFQQAVQETVNVLAWARDQAIQSGADSTVRFDAQTATFHVAIETPASPTDSPTAMEESGEQSAAPSPSRMLALSDDVAVTDFVVYSPAVGALDSGMGAQHEIRFHEDGNCDGARFLLRGTGNYAEVIEISPTSGRVTARDAAEIE